MSRINEEIIEYYNATMATYENVWCTHKNLALHFGYYDEKTKNHKDSLVRINQVLSNMAKIQENDHVLDAGCGIGGSSIWLAKNIGCKVVGINIQSSQLQKAIIYAADNYVSDLVSFEKQNYTATSFDDKKFSVVWAQEALSHTDKKQEFMHEAYRLLKNNGRIILAEYILKESHLNQKEQHIYKKWMDGWAMSDLISKNEYVRILKEAGFKRIESYDLTKNVEPSLRKLYKMTIIYMKLINIFYKLGLIKRLKKNILWQIKNIESSYNQYIALKAQMWKYYVIVAYKD